MIRQCFSRLSSISLPYTLFAVVFSLLIAVGAHPVVAADGDLDISFGTGGKVTTEVGSDADVANSVAIQSDGKIVAAGYSTNDSNNSDFALVRYNTDGSLDTSFDSDGKVTTEVGSDTDAAYSVAIQSDGKIVAAGLSTIDSNNSDFALVRYNTDGSLDTSFGTGGKVTTEVGVGNDIAFDVAIQSDGKIVAAGYSTNDSNLDFALVRYNRDGSLDTSFGTGGKVTTDFGSGTDAALDVAIQSDGKIVAAGLSTNDSNKYDFALVRYNRDGSLDTSFGSDGKVTTEVGSDADVANSVAIQSDGKIVAAGYSTIDSNNNEFALVRYNTDGSLDTSFDSDGKVTTEVGSGDYALSVAIQPDGKIVAAGYSTIDSNNNEFALVRYNTDGSLDTSFGTGGKVTTDFGSGTDAANSVPIQSDGKIVAAGYSTNDSNNSDFALVRYNTDGSLDTSFGTGGKVTTEVGSGTDAALSVAIQPDGKIVAAGASSNDSNLDFALVRYAGTPPAPPTPVSTLPLFGLGILVSLLGLFGLRKLRQ